MPLNLQLEIYEELIIDILRRSLWRLARTTQIGTCATHTMINGLIYCIISTSSYRAAYLLLFFIAVLQYITVGLSHHFLNSNNPLQGHFNKELCMHKNKVEFLQPVFFFFLLT